LDTFAQGENPSIKTASPPIIMPKPKGGVGWDHNGVGKILKEGNGRGMRIGDNTVLAQQGVASEGSKGTKPRFG